MNLNGFIPNSIFVKQVSRLFGGNLIAQTIPIVFTPVLSRYYQPTSFGEWGIFVASTSIALIFATGRFDLAIIVSKGRLESLNLGFALVFLSFFISFIVAPLIGLLFPELLSSYSKMDGLASIVVFAFAVFFGSLRLGGNSWFIKKHLFKKVYTTGIIRSIGYVGSALLIGYFTNRICCVNGLIVSTLAGEFFACFYIFTSSSELKKVYWPGLSKVYGTVVQYKKFFVWGAPGDLLNTFSNQLPLIFLGYYVDSAIVGQFVMARRVLSTPTALISKSTGDVFVAFASSKIQKGNDFSALFKRTFGLLVLVSVPIFALFGFFSSSIFTFILGSDWALAGELARPLSILCGLSFVSSTLGRILQVTGRQKLDFFWQVILCCSVLFSLRWGLEITTFTWIFVASYSMCYILYLYLSYWVTKNPQRPFLGGF